MKNTDFPRERQKTKLPNDNSVHMQLFKHTKKHYQPDEPFGEADTLDEISEETFARIVKELEQFNLRYKGTIEGSRILCKMDHSQSSTNCLQFELGRKGGKSYPSETECQIPNPREIATLLDGLGTTCALS